jgi:uncharacterized membrane protein YfcA
MGWLGPAYLPALLLAVAIVSAACGFIGSAVARRNKRRARRVFLLGFVCGYVAGPVLRKRRRGLNAFASAASHVRQSLPARRRQVGWVHSR